MHALLRNMAATNPRLYYTGPEYPCEACLYNNPTRLNGKGALKSRPANRHNA